MKTKIILVVVFVLALSLALVVSVGATSLCFSTSDLDLPDSYYYPSGLIGDFSPVLDIQYFWCEDYSSNFFCFVILDLEGFKTSTAGLTLNQFYNNYYDYTNTGELDYGVWFAFENAFSGYYSAFGFNNSDDMWSYAQNYEHYGREQVQQAFQIGFDDGRVVGSEEGYQNGLTDGYQDGFNVGYEQGETIGYGDGLAFGYNNGYENGLADGKNEGYNDGLEDSNAFKNGVLAIFSAPVYILNNVLNFDVLGINLYSLITSILTIIIVAWVIKKLAN